MSRITTALAALAAAGAVLAPIAPAHAAGGVLVIDGEPYFDPSGCYLGERRPLVVENHTDGPAYVFSSPYCDGDVVDVLLPGDSAVSEFGTSVFVR
ncbi:hypothetical protein [Nonomuraea sp. SBT364]|uniref:hypothetical protein n=1 Tax=Nonomuraea sp. SBT364 TaxID=1580530 RepID=UPI00066ADD25|nr:hypothetical protein [Nonomuraea sp. SBT364]